MTSSRQLIARYFCVGRGLSRWQHPPAQQVEDVTRIEDLPDLSDADLDRMRAIRDEARQKNGVTPPS